MATHLKQSVFPEKQRRKPAVRAFQGLAGSALAKILKAAEQPSDHGLRVPKTPDREDPIPFNVWFDEFGQKHGRIDLDCAFQDYAFDPHLSHGADCNVDSERPGRFDGDGDAEGNGSVLQDLSLAADVKPCTGLLEGDRKVKRRRPTDKSWWIFDQTLLKDFLRFKEEARDRNEMAKAAFVLYSFYYQNREDQNILEGNPLLEFDTVKQVKQYRQFLVRQGAERFKDQKPESTWHGRRAVWRGFKCKDPSCDQCKRNEISEDFSGRDNI